MKITIEISRSSLGKRIASAAALAPILLALLKKLRAPVDDSNVPLFDVGNAVIVRAKNRAQYGVDDAAPSAVTGVYLSPTGYVYEIYTNNSKSVIAKEEHLMLYSSIAACEERMQSDAGMPISRAAGPFTPGDSVSLSGFGEVGVVIQSDLIASEVKFASSPNPWLIENEKLKRVTRDESNRGD